MPRASAAPSIPEPVELVPAPLIVTGASDIDNPPPPLVAVPTPVLPPPPTPFVVEPAPVMPPGAPPGDPTAPSDAEIENSPLLLPGGSMTSDMDAPDGSVLMTASVAES